MGEKFLLAIVGPTGVGKTEAAMAMARLAPAEIVAVDSMQLYRGMDAGTGKPDRSMRAEVPHHGLDLADPEEEFNAGAYVEQVRPALEQIRERGRLPILVAGSGLYLRALLDGLCQAPGQNPELRKELVDEAGRVGSPALHARLKELDAAAAARIHPNDLRRIIRALEVHSLSGQPLSVLQKQTVGLLDSGWRAQRIGLTCDRDLLYRRIESRIDGWLAGDWVEEAKKLHARPLSRTAREALGYRELFDWLDGRADWPTTVRQIKQNTRRYAKRQWTWFKADPRVEWILTDGTTSKEAAAAIWNKLSSLTSI